MDTGDIEHEVQRFQVIHDTQRRENVVDRRVSYRRELLSQRDLLMKSFKPLNNSLKIVAKKVENPFTEDNVCSICLDNDDTQCRQLECGHIFHGHCIKRWLNTTGVLKNNHTCPLCRVNVHIKTSYT